jgi:hypothetical protein
MLRNKQEGIRASLIQSVARHSEGVFRKRLKIWKAEIREEGRVLAQRCGGAKRNRGKRSDGLRPQRLVWAHF